MGAVFTFLSTFLGSKAGLYMVIGAVAIGGWAMWYFEDIAHDNTKLDAATKIERAANNVRVMTQAVKNANDAVSAMKQAQEADRLSRARLTWEYDLIKTKMDEANAKIDSYRTRWAKASTKRPTLVARIINRATRKRVHEIAAATCRSNCGSSGDTDSGAGASETP